MTLFGSIMPGQGHGQGAHALSLLGMEGIPRKGLTGNVQEHASLSKAAVVRTCQDGFGISQLSNIDLVSHRASRPDKQNMQNHAGSIPGDRRGPDVPAVIRQTSIEHGLQRRHSCECPPRRQRSHENLITRMSSAETDAQRVGRNVSRSRSPSPTRSPAPSPISQYRKTRSRSPLAVTIPENSPCFQPVPRRATRSSSAEGRFCSWGQDLSFEHIRSSCEVEQMSTSFDFLRMRSQMLAEFEHEASDAVALERKLLLELEVANGSGSRSVSRRHSKSSDDGRSTISTGLSGTPRSPCDTSFSSPMDTCRSDCTYQSSYCGEAVSVLNFAKNMDKRSALSYERRIQAMVKAEQKKAKKRVS